MGISHDEWIKKRNGGADFEDAMVNKIQDYSDHLNKIADKFIEEGNEYLGKSLKEFSEAITAPTFDPDTYASDKRTFQDYTNKLDELDGFLHERDENGISNYEAIFFKGMELGIFPKSGKYYDEPLGVLATGISMPLEIGDIATELSNKLEVYNKEKEEFSETGMDDRDRKIATQLLEDELERGSLDKDEQGMQNLRQLKFQLEAKSIEEYRKQKLNPERYQAFVDLKDSVDELVEVIDKTQQNMEYVWESAVKPGEDDKFEWQEIGDEELKADIFDEARKGIIKATNAVKKLDSSLQKMKELDKNFVEETVTSSKNRSTFLVNWKKDYEKYDMGEELQNAAFDSKYSKMPQIVAEQKKKAAAPKKYQPDNRTIFGRTELAIQKGLDLDNMEVLDGLRPDYGDAIQNPAHEKLLAALKKQQKLLEKDGGVFDLYGKLHGNTQEFTEMKKKLDKTIREMQNNPYYIYEENGKRALEETFSAAQVYYGKKFDGAGKDTNKKDWAPSSTMGKNRLNGSLGIMEALEEVLPRERLTDISYNNAKNRVNEKLEKAIRSNNAADIQKYAAEAVAARAIQEKMAFKEQYADIKTCDLFSPESVRKMGVSTQKTKEFQSFTKQEGYLAEIQDDRIMHTSNKVFDDIMQDKKKALINNNEPSIRQDIVIKKNRTLGKH